MVEKIAGRTNWTTICWYLLTLVGLASGEIRGESGPLAPDRLLIYYGHPSSINGTHDVVLAATEFANYQHVVLGEGLEDGPGDPHPHQDHANTIAIINRPIPTAFYGYVDLGVTTQNLSMTEIRRRVTDWDAMNVDGILLDNFGYDFGVSRARQNEAVDFIHSRGLLVIANGFFVDDVFGQAVNINNPIGAPTHLNGNDYYLFESHQVVGGTFQPEQVWLDKANALESYQNAIGFGVFSITTNSIGNSFDKSAFHYSWFSAALRGHDATGWGEYLFSASGISNAIAPMRMRPEMNIGAAFRGTELAIGSIHGQRTDRGVIIVDAGGFEAFFLGYGDANGNGHVQLSDWPTLRRCLLGPAQPSMSPTCIPRHFAVIDTDADEDVDLRDWSEYQNSFTG